VRRPEIPQDFRRTQFLPFDEKTPQRIFIDNQCAHWWRKHFLKSAGRPETPQRFRPAQFFSETR